MELHNAHELKEVYSAQEATQAIQNDGWTLLAVTSAQDISDPFGKHADKLRPCYVLGKPAPKKDPLEGVNLGGMVSAVQMNVRD